MTILITTTISLACEMCVALVGLVLQEITIVDRNDLLGTETQANKVFAHGAAGTCWTQQFPESELHETLA